MRKLQKEIWKSLRDAFRISYANTRHHQTKHRKTHRHAVISVRFDFGPVQEAGHYSKRIAFFGNTRAAFLQFDVQRLHALGFLHPQPPKFHERFRFVRKRRKHDRRHDAVPEVLPARDRSGEGLQDARKLRIDLPGKSQSEIAYGFTAISRLDPRYDAYFAMNNILGQFGLGGRLADNIRERQGMAYYAFSAFDPSVGIGPLIVRAGVDPDNVTRALDAIDQEVRVMGTAGATAEELAQTKQFLIGSIPRTLETNSGIASFLQSEEQFGLGLDYDRRLADDIRAVTLEQVREAAAELLHPDRASVAVAGPPRTE